MTSVQQATTPTSAVANTPSAAGSSTQPNTPNPATPVASSTTPIANTPAAVSTTPQPSSNTPVNTPAAQVQNTPANTPAQAATQANSIANTPAAAQGTSTTQQQSTMPAAIPSTTPLTAMNSTTAAPNTTVAVNATSATTHALNSTTSITSKTTSLSSSANVATAIIGANNANSTTTHQLSTGAKAGIGGGVGGGILLLLLLLLVWRWRKRERVEKVLPPPPRDMTYSSAMPRASVLGSPGGMGRAESFAGLLPGGASQYGNHSRHPSYYNTYPIATPSTISHEASPPIPPTIPLSDGSPPITASHSGSTTPQLRPSLQQINTAGLQRDSSGSSGSAVGEMGQAAQPRQKSSVDRLRSAAAAEGSRAPSPSQQTVLSHPSGPSEPGSSRANSPHPSHGLNSSPASTLPRNRHSYTNMQGYSPHGRPQSMHSLSSARFLGPGPIGNAPHHGRPMDLQMPKLLGSPQISDSPTEWGQSGMYPAGPAYGMPRYDDPRHQRRTSRQFSELDYAAEYAAQTRKPSSSGLSNLSNDPAHTLRR